MIIAKVKFGQTHAVTTRGDIFKGKQEIHIACAGTLEITVATDSRYKLFENTGEHVGCAVCRQVTGLDRKEEQNAD